MVGHNKGVFMYEVQDMEGKTMLKTKGLMLAYKFMKVCEANQMKVKFLIGGKKNGKFK